MYGCQHMRHGEIYFLKFETINQKSLKNLQIFSVVTHEIASYRTLSIITIQLNHQLLKSVDTQSTIGKLNAHLTSIVRNCVFVEKTFTNDASTFQFHLNQTLFTHINSNGITTLNKRIDT